MKKFIALLLCVIMPFTVTGCLLDKKENKETSSAEKKPPVAE